MKKALEGTSKLLLDLSSKDPRTFPTAVSRKMKSFLLSPRLFAWMSGCTFILALGPTLQRHSAPLLGFSFLPAPVVLFSSLTPQYHFPSSPPQINPQPFHQL